MLKSTLFQHKQEKARLLAKTYIGREKLDFARGFLETPLIKIITGPRRAGKSVFALLLLIGKNFAYVNFDDENLLKVTDYEEIVRGLAEVYGETKYLFFDEIQNLANWEIFVNKLQRRGYNLVLTGSNAKLLSREWATSLTGRHIAFEIWPFSFREFLQAKNYDLAPKQLAVVENKGQLLNLLDGYLVSGGFPETTLTSIEPQTYLAALFDAVILKDVVGRYNLRFSQKISELASYLLSIFSAEMSFNKLKNALDFSSVNTLQSYIRYLEDAYLVCVLNRFSFKVREQIKTAKKVYVVDNGFISARSLRFSPDTGRLMENMVFDEFLKRGYKPNTTLFYYQTRNRRQVDFLLKRDLGVEKLVQVCLQTEDPVTREREIKALREAGGELNCRNLEVITWEEEREENFQGTEISFLPLWKFLIS